MKKNQIIKKLTPAKLTCILLYFITLLASNYPGDTYAAITFNGSYLGPISNESAWVCWMSDTPTTNNQVEYGLTSSYGSISTGSSGTAVHDGLYRNEVEVTGLLPDTTYHYRVRCDGEVASDYTFKTFPSPYASSVKFIVMGDTQSSNSVPNKPLSDYISEHENVSLVLRVGDLVNAGQGDTYTYWNDQHFENVQNLMHSAWIAATPGNHEAMGDGPTPAVPTKYLNTFKFPANTTNPDHYGFYYSFDIGNVHIVSLRTNGEVVNDVDNNSIWNTYNPVDNPYSIHYSDERNQQMNWYMNDVANAKARGMKWIVAFGHSPIYSSGGYSNHAGSETRGQQIVGFRDALIESETDYYFSGHSHCYLRFKPTLFGELDPSGQGLRCIVTAPTHGQRDITIDGDAIATQVWLGSYDNRSTPKYWDLNPLDWIPWAGGAGNDNHRAAIGLNYNGLSQSTNQSAGYIDATDHYIVVEMFGNRARTTCKYMNRDTGEVHVYDVEEWTNSSIVVQDDTEKPSVPQNVTAVPLYSTKTNVSWSPSTDNVGVSTYSIFRNGTFISNTFETSFQDAGLTPDTEYTYTIQANDAATNVSDHSLPATARTNKSGYSIPEIDSWEVRGIGGGGALFNPQISPYNHLLMTVTCDMGGFYITNDGGEHWKMCNMDGMVYSVSFDHNSNDIYAGVRGNTSGIHKTGNFGETWEAVLTGDGLEGYVPVNIAIDPDDAKFIYVALGSGHGFYYGGGGQTQGDLYILKYTTDGGATWQTGGSGLPSGSDRLIRSILIDPSTPKTSRTVYISIGGGSYGIYRSSDGGQTFVTVNDGLPSSNVYDLSLGYDAVSGANRLYASINGAGVFTSTDKGDNWTGTNLNQTNVQQIEASNNSHNIAYVMVENGYGIYKTEDGGGSWASVLRNDNFSDGYIDDKNGFGQGFPMHGLAVSGSNNQNVVWTDYSRIATSYNGGTSWEQKYTGYHGDWETSGVSSIGLEVTTIHDIVFCDNNTKMFIPYTDQGLWMSEDNAQTLKFRGDGTNWNWYSIVSDEVNNVLYGGVGKGNDIPVQRHEIGDHSTGKLLKSNDWGITWTESGSGLPDDAVVDILLDNQSDPASRLMYAATVGSGFYRSMDSGATWTAINSGIGNNRSAYRIKKASDGTLYGVILLNSDNENGALYRSTDNGDNWEEVSIAPLSNILDIAIHPVDPAVLYICGFPRNGTGGVYRSSDGGNSWLRVLAKDYVFQLTVDSRHPDLVYATICQDDDIVLGQGVYGSGDKGTNWQALEGMPFRNCKRVVLDPTDSRQLYVATWGGGILASQTNAVGLMADVNNDGVVDIKDVITCVNAINSDTDADANGDNETNIQDVITIVNAIIG